MFLNLQQAFPWQYLLIALVPAILILFYFLNKKNTLSGK